MLSLPCALPGMNFARPEMAALLHCCWRHTVLLLWHCCHTRHVATGDNALYLARYCHSEVTAIDFVPRAIDFALKKEALRVGMRGRVSWEGGQHMAGWMHAESVALAAACLHTVLVISHRRRCDDVALMHSLSCVPYLPPTHMHTGQVACW